MPLCVKVGVTEAQFEGARVDVLQKEGVGSTERVKQTDARLVVDVERDWIRLTVAVAQADATALLVEDSDAQGEALGLREAADVAEAQRDTSVDCVLSKDCEGTAEEDAEREASPLALAVCDRAGL